jgi:hypothetical protein
MTPILAGLSTFLGGLLIGAAYIALRYARQARHYRQQAAWWQAQHWDLIERGIGWRRPPASRGERARA